MYITTRIKVQVTPEQEDVLWHLSERCRLLYNFALAGRKANYQENKERSEKHSIGYVQQANALPELKKKYPEYKWVYSKVLQTTLQMLDNDFKSFFALRAGGDETAQPPEFKGKHWFCTLCYNQSGFKIADGWITFSHFYNDVPLTFKILDQPFDNVKQVDLFHDNLKNEYYVSIVHEVQPVQEYVDNGQYQAWDLGITKHVAVNSAGKFIGVTNARPDKYWNNKIDAMQSQRDHCKKVKNQRPSRRWRRYNAAKRKMERKRSNQIKDIQHKLSKKLVENTKATTIVVGDLCGKTDAAIKTGNPRSESFNTEYRVPVTVHRIFNL